MLDSLKYTSAYAGQLYWWMHYELQCQDDSVTLRDGGMETYQHTFLVIHEWIVS